MKILSTLLLGGLLATSSAFADTASDADQKWLVVVSTMVADNHSKISTPSEKRATLVKDWAAKNGYSAEVTKTATGYQIEFTKSLAKNNKG